MLEKARGHRLHLGILGIACLAGLATATSSDAATGRSFIGPHEYALPANVPDGFDVFLLYSYYEIADERFNESGRRVDADRTATLVSLAKFSQGWTLASNPNFGYAWEVILPISNARNKTANVSASGIGDPVVAPYIWYKLNENVTIGTDFLFALPLGNSDVGGGDAWKFTNSVFIDVQAGSFNYTGDVIWNFPGTSTQHDERAGRSWSTEHLFSYRTGDLIEPYGGFSYERQSRSAINEENSETNLAAGLMFHFKKGPTAALHWVHAIDGKNRPVSDSLNLRFVWSL